MSEPSLDALAGRVIDDRYTLLKKLGAGGMGAVYTATQASMQRTVAIKLIAPRLITDDTVTRRFLREAQLSGRIAHPYVVSAFDSGRTPDGLHYLVMEYIEGETLADTIARDAPFSIERAVQMAVQICEGLNAAHAQDVVHRDLKPANVMLVRGAGAETIKLLDFGLARSVRGDMSMLTETGVMFGTPTYMPPEVARGENCDGRGDLYALGVMLFEMLTGQPPFSGTHALALAMQHANTPPPDLPQSVPVSLAQLVGRLLAKEPNARPASASATRALLLSCLAQVQTPAQPAPSITSLEGVAFSKKTRWPLWMAGLLCLGAGVAWWAWPAPLVDPPSVPETLTRPETAAPETAAPETAAPETAAPETAAPETAAPETAAPETVAPKTAQSAAPKTRPAAPTTRKPRWRRPVVPSSAPPSAAPPTAAPVSARSVLPGAFIRP